MTIIKSFVFSSTTVRPPHKAFKRIVNPADAIIATTNIDNINRECGRVKFKLSIVWHKCGAIWDFFCKDRKKHPANQKKGA